MTVLGAALVTVAMIVADLLADRWGLATVKDWDSAASLTLIGFAVVVIVALIGQYDN